MITLVFGICCGVAFGGILHAVFDWESLASTDMAFFGAVGGIAACVYIWALL